MRIYLIIIILLSCSNGIQHGLSEAGEFDPWNFNESVVNNASNPIKNLSIAAYVMYHGTNLFSRYISPVDGDRCSMYPTCSSYSRKAFAKHGFVIGIVMTVDRLIHENNEVDIAKEIIIGGVVRYDDPVENNDFWWSKYR
jgi:hypothetical protein